jgi:hypothetical protein
MADDPKLTTPATGLVTEQQTTEAALRDVRAYVKGIEDRLRTKVAPPKVRPTEEAEAELREYIARENAREAAWHAQEHVFIREDGSKFIQKGFKPDWQALKKWRGPDGEEGIGRGGLLTLSGPTTEILMGDLALNQVPGGQADPGYRYEQNPKNRRRKV